VRHSSQVPLLQNGLVTAHWLSAVQLVSVTQRSLVQVKPQIPSQSGSVQIGFVGAYSGFLQLQIGVEQVLTVQTELEVEQSYPLTVQASGVSEVSQVLAAQSAAVRHVAVPK
jgi:hypothetical protein